MLLTLLLILNMEDSDFYSHKDFLSQIDFNDLITVSDPEICVLGPKDINLKENFSLPIYYVFSANSYDHHFVHPLTHGYIIISSMKTGSLAMIPVSDSWSNKPPQKERPTYENRVNSHFAVWKDINIPNFFPIQNDVYHVSAYCGNMVSNKIVVNATFSDSIPTELKYPEHPSCEEFFKTIQITKVIDIKSVDKEMKLEYKNRKISGTITYRVDEHLINTESIDLNISISCNSLPHSKIYSLTLARDFEKPVGNVCQYNFDLELGENFIEMLNNPEEIHVTSFYREIASDVVTIDCAEF